MGSRVVRRPARGNPHRGFLRRKLRNLGIAYLIGVPLALCLGMAAAGVRREAREKDFSARGVEVPDDLRQALAGRDPEDLRRAVERSPALALQVIVDREVGLPGLSDPDYVALLDAAAPAFPVKPLLDDFRKLFSQRRGLGVRPSDLREQRAALRILQGSRDPAALEALRLASWLPRDRAIENEARRLLEARAAAAPGR